MDTTILENNFTTEILESKHFYNIQTEIWQFKKTDRRELEWEIQTLRKSIKFYDTVKISLLTHYYYYLNK